MRKSKVLRFKTDYPKWALVGQYAALLAAILLTLGYILFLAANVELTHRATFLINPFVCLLAWAAFYCFRNVIRKKTITCNT